jgi:hypothetical protein
MDSTISRVGLGHKCGPISLPFILQIWSDVLVVAMDVHAQRLPCRRHRQAESAGVAAGDHMLRFWTVGEAFCQVWQDRHKKFTSIMKFTLLDLN